MVQLKVSKLKKNVEIILFQFLMVQLKDHHDIINIRDKNVSIPNGAIKRPAGCILQISACVSIPNGAIKSFVREIARTMGIRFQFLMVQLKGEYAETGDDKLFKFQFLMVQLKAGVHPRSAVDEL